MCDDILTGSGWGPGSRVALDRDLPNTLPIHVQVLGPNAFLPSVNELSTVLRIRASIWAMGMRLREGWTH